MKPILSISHYLLRLVVLLLFILILTPSARSQCNTESLMNKCASGLDEFVFIKSFPIECKADQKGGYQYVLSTGIHYKIVVCDEQSPGSKMVVNLLDRNKKMIASNYLKASKKIFPVVNYVCPATGVYYIEAYFEGDKKGCGINILGFKKQ